ncbi:MAG: hypothetical protein MJ137_08435 [Clostridia bacterium]|nr:hypothetical protein [Clostridia bacterium]
MNTKRRFLSAVLALTILMSVFCIAPIHAEDGDTQPGISTLSIRVETYLFDWSGEVISTYHIYNFTVTSPGFGNLDLFMAGDMDSMYEFIDGIIEDYDAFNKGVTIVDGAHSGEPKHLLKDIVLGCPGEISVTENSVTENSDGSLNLKLELKQVPDTFTITYMYGPDPDKSEPYSVYSATYFAGSGFFDNVLDTIAEGYMYAGAYTDATFTVPASYIVDEGDCIKDFEAYDGLEIFVKCVPEYLYGASFLTVSNPDPKETDGNGGELPRVTDVYALMDLPGLDFAGIGVMTAACSIDELNELLEETLGALPEDLEDDEIRYEYLSDILYWNFMPNVDLQIPAECYSSVVCEGVMEKKPRTANDSVGVSKLDFSGNYSYSEPVNGESLKYVSDIMFYTSPFYITKDGIVVQMNPSYYVVKEGSKLLEPVSIAFGIDDYMRIDLDALSAMND